MVNYHLLSLGCPKNLVDSERLSAELARLGLSPAAQPEEAAVVVINTCGFIREACEESLEAILAAAKLKEAPGRARLLVVAGCLPGRYGAELASQLPEVDLFFGPLAEPEAAREAADKIASMVAAAAGASPEGGCLEPPRLTPAHRAYVKIAEGCSNRCTYCTIPSIRGRRRSRPLEDIIQEVARLSARGVREVTLVAQDSSAYGADLSPKASLAGLLEALRESPDGPDWLRVLYLHPARVDGRLIEALSAGGRIIPYFDLPVQHAAAPVLRAMGRGYDASRLLRLTQRIRERAPQAVLRASVIVGFPGEGKREFAELLDFIVQAAFDHLGCFVFSPEEGTPAASLRPRISRRVAEERRGLVMELQATVSQARNEALVGQVLPVLIEGIEDGRVVGRAMRHAPEIDGQVIINGVINGIIEGPAKVGEIIPVRITAASDYDLTGTPLI